MIYLDTNVIISYMDEADPNHETAKKFIKSSHREKKLVSQLTLVELASVYARGNISEPQAFAIYSIKEVEAEIISVDFSQILNEAFRLSHTVKLRTLDLIHISICKTKNVKNFLTFDKDIIAKKDNLKKIGINVIEPK